MNNRRRGKALTTNIPIYTLSGGVGRQAPSKRLPSESQELLNALVSVERSVEKRPGTDLMGINLGAAGYSGENLGLPSDGVFEFFWHSLSDDARYLIIIDRSADTEPNKLFYTFFYNQQYDYFEDHTAIEEDQNNIPDSVRAYITYKEEEEDDYKPLRMVSRGQNLVFLNPDKEAGYLTAGNGIEISPANTDIVGGYSTALKVDPQGLAVFWDSYSNYGTGAEVLVVPGVAEAAGGSGVVDNGILATNGSGEVTDYYILQAQTTVAANQPVDNEANWVVVATDAASWSPGPNAPLLDLERAPRQISVKDFEYPDSTKPQLGQSLPTFNDLRLPPLASDVSDGNNGAEALLADMYGLTTNATPGEPTSDSADGKVYYIQTGYQGQAPGYYLMKDVTAPHTLKVRTPDAYSVLDSTTLPMQLEFVGGAPGSQWEWSEIEWAPRTSGDLTTNPGPTPFKNGRTAKISTIAFFRNRLWMSSGDVVFSSREGDFTDLWLEDPGLLIDTDPIDIAASTNTFTPITSMVPFKEYMFVNTNADTQYELMGSENQITPFTAELQPMTFYSTAPLVDPLTLGNNIFFFDAERLYLYLGRGGTLSTAAELSSHCPKYLPRNYGATAIAAAQDTILAVDGDAKSDVYLYTTRYRGEQVLQNAFYKFVYEDAEVLSMKSWDNDVYMVMQRGEEFFIERQLMRFDEQTVPRLDRKQKIALTLGSTLSVDDPKFSSGAVVNATQDLSTYRTTVRIPLVLTTEEIEDYVFVQEDGVRYDIEEVTATTDYSDIVVKGLVPEGNVWVGKTFTTLIQLSTQFLREENNNPTEGILNIASMVTRHFETGNYDVISQRRGRPVPDVLAAYSLRDPALSTFTTKFVAPRVDTFDESNLSIGNIENQGELVSKIMGFSDKLEIFILSDYFTPMNITNLQLRGKFKQTYSSII